MLISSAPRSASLRHARGPSETAPRPLPRLCTALSGWADPLGPELQTQSGNRVDLFIFFAGCFHSSKSLKHPDDPHVSLYIDSRRGPGSLKWVSRALGLEGARSRRSAGLERRRVSARQQSTSPLRFWSSVDVTYAFRTSVVLSVISGLLALRPCNTSI